MGHILFCISVSRTNIGKNGIDKKSATAGHFSRSTFFSTAVAGNSNFVLFTYTIFTTIVISVLCKVLVRSNIFVQEITQY